MHKVTNLTNCPFDLQGADGSVRLPAFGSIAARFSPEYIELLKAGLAVKVELAENASEQPPKRGPGRPRKTELD